MLEIAGGRPVNYHIFDVIGFTRIIDFAIESKIQAKSGGDMSRGIGIRREVIAYYTNTYILYPTP
jgi:hypothetical protein